MNTKPQPKIVRRSASPEALDALRVLPPLQRRVFAQRGITDPSELELSLRQLHPVNEFPVCIQAAELLYSVMREDGRILLVGDYDADGATGVAVAIRSLHAMGYEHVDYLVPDRFRHGYGFCPELMEEVEQRSPALIVTVDNGMSSQAAVAEARKRGIRVLITDHHLPGDELPEADCIVNPNSPPDSFASTALAGVGVMFYVMLALRQHLEGEGWFARHGIEMPNMAQFLDLVALGTIADVVPLDQNNRILVEHGLRCIRQGRGAPGIISLLRCGKRDPRQVGSTDLAFAVAPRINAAGRMEDIAIGIRCLLTEGRVEAHDLAQQLDQINTRRRDEQGSMHTEALREVEQLSIDAEKTMSLCLYRSNWHEGVVGIIASQIKEKVGLPTIVFARSQDNLLKGSGRSVQGLNLRDALVDVEQAEPGLMQRYGGHAMAVGLTLREDGLERFQGLLEEAVSKALGGSRPSQTIETDGELASEELTLENAEFAVRGHPWGRDFLPPLFEGEFEVQERKTFKGAHTRFHLNPIGHPERRVKAMAFSHDRFDWNPESSRFRLVYELSVDEYQGHRSCMLNIQHIESL